MPEEKKKYLIKKIDSLSKTLGLEDKEQTLFAIKKTANPNIKELHLQSGDMKEEEPWFAIDEDDDKKAYAFVPLEAFTQMINVLKQVQKENFDLKLEKTIWQNIPNDFDDVWIVAMQEIRELAKSEDSSKPVSIDLEKLIRDIKEKHPNLFVNMKDFFPQQIQNHQGTK